MSSNEEGARWKKKGRRQIRKTMIKPRRQREDRLGGAKMGANFVRRVHGPMDGD